MAARSVALLRAFLKRLESVEVKVVEKSPIRLLRQETEIEETLAGELDFSLANSLPWLLLAVAEIGLSCQALPDPPDAKAVGRRPLWSART